MMSPITLSSHLITRLSTLSSNDTGYLIGLYPDMKHDDKHIHVIGSVKGDDSTLASIRLSLPTGCLDIVGTYTTSTSTSTSTSSFPLTFQYNIDTHDIKITSHGATITYTVDDTITLNQYIPFRLIYTHDTYVYTRDGLKPILSSYINNLSSITLHIPSTDQLIPNYSHTDADIWNDTCTSLVNEHKSTSWMERVTTMNVMENMDVEGGDAPVVMYTNGLSQHTIYPITIHIDVLCFASTTDTIDTVLHTCITRVGEYLQHIISNIDNDMNDTVLIRDGHDLSRMILRTYHFIPSTLSHPITLMYPSYTYHDISTSDDESYLLSRRQSLHTTWCLPMDRPILRITNALSWDTSSTSTSGRLHNVHLHIPSSPIQGGTQYLVSGEYAYYHYMQDKFNDAGWGCAYRTLQTICSWYILNHYVHGRTVPTHRDIQQILVEHDGKPRTLIGSREWIGAIEVGTVLNHWMNVESRNLFITSGSEIPTHARDLAKHFQTQGTPVMIGGGQLAYGLLGIDWNAKTGECAYLILDPHYTGGEHIQTIIGKGWCGWKGPELFLPNEFYNFCLPQRPHQI